MNLLDEMKREVKSDYERFKEFDDYELSRNDYAECDRNGNRLKYENRYFAKRACLTARALYAYLTNKTANDDLVHIINSVCDEFSWVLPGHKADNPHIDLYSAITAQMLCEIAYYIRIPDELHNKIHSIVKIRIKDEYENNVSAWESYKNNWLPVCAGRVGMVYLYEFPDDFPKIKQRILQSMERYIEGFGNDGACVEGVGYWRFGFGNYLYFAEMLKRVEGTDILKGEKIREIAKFQQYMFIKNDMTVSFSDTSKHRGTFNIGVTHFMKSVFGDEIKVPPVCYRDKISNCYDWASAFRSIHWFCENIADDDGYFRGEATEKYFGDAKWYINRKKNFAFAAKAGNNNELHNHNDLGSFIITDGNVQLISDFGAGEYTKNYFTLDKRYEIFCCSSAGHSVPVIDGKYQSFGKQYKSDVIESGNNRFYIEMSGAYEIDGLTGLRREFDVRDNSVTLCDKFTFLVGSHSVTERLISMVRPEKENKAVKLGEMTINANCEAQLSEKEIKGHRGELVTLYIMDFALKGKEFKAEFSFEGGQK